MTKYILKLTPFLAASLFYGCSGHALQDLVDGNSTNNLSSKNSPDDRADKMPAPSQNSALQSISPSSTASDDHQEYRYIQQNTNEWLEKEWSPLSESSSSDVNISNSDNLNKESGLSENNSSTYDNEDENGSFTLQHYVDKAKIYHENKEKLDDNTTKAPSHVDKVNAMPGIGKIEGR